MADSTRDLVVTDLAKHYPSPEGKVEVLSDVSLRASAGETVAIVGPSGSGKSTLLNIIGSLDQPSTGTVRLGETEVTTLTGTALADFRATRVGFVFQDHHLLPQLSALENVLLPTLAVKQRGVDAQRVAAGVALLERMGVRTRADAFPSQMSGGERQRVAIARALINGAGLLLCDEPTGNLDRETGAGIVALFLELAATQGVTVLMVTHNMAHAARFSRVLELRGGRVVPAQSGEVHP
jgi:lipoprotein-releasing system ATP-binding protein